MQNVPFRAIVSDLDGTLLNANHMITSLSRHYKSLHLKV